MEELRRRIEAKIKEEDSKILHEMLSSLRKVGVYGNDNLSDSRQVINSLQKVLSDTRQRRVQVEHNKAMKKIVDHLERDVLCDQIQTTGTNQTTSTAGAHTASGNAGSSGWISELVHTNMAVSDAGTCK